MYRPRADAAAVRVWKFVLQTNSFLIDMMDKIIARDTAAHLIPLSPALVTDTEDDGRGDANCREEGLGATAATGAML